MESMYLTLFIVLVGLLLRQRRKTTLENRARLLAEKQRDAAFTEIGRLGVVHHQEAMARGDVSHVH